jgi:GH3 auxin-responsive promoter
MQTEPAHVLNTSSGGVPNPPAGATDAPSSEQAEAKPAVFHREHRDLRRTPYPALLGKALVAASHVQVAFWDRAMRHVEEHQVRALRAIVGHAAGTEFGRRHSFAHIKDHSSYARNVPLGDYDSHAPAIERMRKGERGLLVPEFVRYFGNSAGSSNQGKSKFLPITERQIAHQRRAGTDAVMRYLRWSRDDRFITGFTLGLFPPTTMREEGPVLITSNPALMVTRLPAFTRPAYLPDESIKHMADYEAKLTAVAERYADHDVRAISGTTCWFPLMFERLIDVAQRRGRRATCVADLWPNLRLLIGGGVSAEPYVPVIRKLVGRDDVTLVDTYNATEGGFYASSDTFGGDRSRGMLMLPHRGTFFEFVPLEERGKPNPTRVPLWAVERDKPYSIVPTTVSGLYAYELGDIVRFPSTDPLRIEFMGRLSGCLSLTQELTTHVEVESAVAHAIAECPCRTVDFGVAGEVGADGGAKGRYVLFVEFDAGAEPPSLPAFAAAFDEGLRKINRVYREHREGEVAILPPRVEPLVRGGAKKFLDATTRGNVQGKFPRILDGGRKEQLMPFVRSSSRESS